MNTVTDPSTGFHAIAHAPKIGNIWIDQGGIYAGIMRGENGQPDYHLIVPTHTDAYVKEVVWGGKGVDETGANSDRDGLANTLALCKSDTDHPAAQWITALTVDDFSDFYLPARHELRLCYLNVPELFDTDDWYWSSTQYAANPAYAWIQNFSYGSQLSTRKVSSSRARAVRRLLIIE